MEQSVRDLFPDPEEREFLAEVIEIATGEAETALKALKEQPFVDETTEETFTRDVEDYSNTIARAQRQLDFLQRLNKWFGGDT